MKWRWIKEEDSDPGQLRCLESLSADGTVGRVIEYAGCGSHEILVEDEGNRRLIEATPDLLDLVRRYVANLGPHPEEFSTIDEEAVALLLKIDGRS